MPFGMTMVAPVIMKFGTEEQKRRFLPDILNTNVWWCQGYSEPGSGSDLASLRTKAEDKGDHFLVNGVKTWTTLAQYADWIFCLVRTSQEAKQQMGISFLLIDMRTPGVTVNPIVTLDQPRSGHQEINMVYFENVVVPKENLVGEVGKGWTCAKYLLEFERGNAYSPTLKGVLAQIRAMAAAETNGDGAPMIADAAFKARIDDVEVQVLAMEFTELRILGALAAGSERRPRIVAAEDARHGVAAGDHRTRARSIGYYATPFDASTPYEGDNFQPVGPELRERRRAGLLQHAQGIDLRRIERNPAQHHVEAGVGPRLNASAQLQQQHQQQRRADCLQQHEAHEHLGVRPAQVLAHVIVQRIAHAAEDRNAEEPQQRDLQQARAAVDEHHGRNDEHEKRIAAGQHQHAQQQPDGARAGVAHQHDARIAVVPEVTRQTSDHRKRQHRPRRAVGVVGQQQIGRDVFVAKRRRTELRRETPAP